MFDLRDYQTDLVTRAIKSVEAGHTPVVVGPTGCGKTVLIAEIARQFLKAGHRILAVCHRREILQQLHRSLSGHLDTKDVAVIAAGIPETHQTVSTAMVPSLVRRRRSIERLRGCVLLMDECHHVTGASWRRLRDALEPAHVIGFTATPITPTGGGLGRYGFDDLIVGPSPSWLIENGFLCNYKMYGPNEEIDTSNMRVIGGDFSTDEIEEAAELIRGSVVRDWRQYNPDGKHTIAVGATVRQSNRLLATYREAGITAETVFGNTAKNDRDRIFDDFRNGRISVLCACSVIDEGLDVPEATCLQIVRPTRSLRLYKQLIGRVMRPAENKEHAIIIDHGGSWRTLALPCEDVPWSLADRVRRRRRPAQRNPETQEVTTPPAYVETAERLSEVTPRRRRLSAEDKRQQAIAKANLRLEKTIDRIEAGLAPPSAARLALRDAKLLSFSNLQQLELFADLPRGWASAHHRINQERMAREAATG